MTNSFHLFTFIFSQGAVQIECSNILASTVHCNENPMYVFLFWEFRGLSPNFHIQVSVSDLYIHRIGPHIWLQQNRQTDPGNI